jgi:tetratricopeptide (TPR) repeat protein
MSPTLVYDWMAAVDSFLNLYEKGDNDNAWDSINKAYRIIPTAYLRYWRGVIAGRREDFAEAARELDAAWKERQDPHRALRIALAEIAGVDPELRDKVDGMTRLRLPENELSVNLAASLYHLSRYADAVSWAERAALDPKHREGALELLGRAEHKLQRYSSSLIQCDVLFKETSNRRLKANTARTAAYCAGRLGDDAAVFKWIGLALDAGCERSELYDSEDLQAYRGRPEFERLLG